MQNNNYVSAPVFLAAFVACCLEPATGSCDGSAPNYLALECRISAASDRCYQYVDAEKTGVNTCSARLPCQVWTGMQLDVSCGDDEDASVQDVYMENCKQGRRNFSWPFAAKSAVQGVYMCIRNGDSAVISNRSIIVDESAHVIPGPDATSMYRQFCIQDIVPGFNCSVADVSYYFSDDISTPNYVKFNVLGARPIELNVEPIWTDHYPVDLGLSYNTEASNSTTPQVIEFVTGNLVFVVSQSVEVFLAITASNSFGSSTMCVRMTILGEATLITNESLPEDLTVAEGQPAVFHCQAKTTRDHGLKATVAFLVHSPDSPEPMQCLNCSFSPSSLFSCTKTVDKGGCYGLRFLNSTSGQDFDKTHHLTAQWDQVGAGQNGSVVTCAIAVKGTIQWQNSATLIIIINANLTKTPNLPTTPTPERINDNSDGKRNVMLISIGAVVAVMLVTVGLSVVAWCFYRKRNSSVFVTPDGKKWQRAPTEDDIEL